MKNKEDNFKDLGIYSNDVIVKLENPFIDERGEIQPLVDSLMKSAVLIRSKPNTLRANHYHKTDWHYCYVLSGEIEYYYRKTNSSIPKKKLIVKKGQMVFPPPLVDHAMVFNVETTFLTLSRNPRDQKSYEKDVVRINLIEPEDLITWTPKNNL